ncbi:MAG: hypothetical protein OHK0012_23350 [Synechococcales cyanobacterium]
MNRYIEPRDDFPRQRRVPTWADPVFVRIDQRQLWTWAGLAMGWLLVLLWNWQLALALLLGAGAALARTVLTSPMGGTYWLHVQRLYQQVFSQEWVRTVLLGAGVLLATFTVLSIWSESDHHWATVSSIGQSLALLGVLSVLSIDIWQRRQQDYQRHCDHWLETLRAAEPQKRLLAVRRLQGLVCPYRDPEGLKLAMDMVQLGLEREDSALVREAMLEALHSWRHL